MSHSPSSASPISSDAETPSSVSSPSTEKTSFPDAPGPTSDDAQSTSDTPQSAPPRRSSPSIWKKIWKKLPIGYIIFLLLLLFVLFWLIDKKVNAPEEVPMHSLPSEKPVESINYKLLPDSSIVIVSDSDISLLSAELPSVLTHEYTPSELGVDLGTDEDVPYDDYIPDVVSSPSRHTESQGLKLTTEQSIRNLLISNRFINQNTSDILTFSKNGNELLLNGESLTTEMEVASMGSSAATLNFYDDSNTSWDVELDITGTNKSLRFMDVIYISD